MKKINWRFLKLHISKSNFYLFKDILRLVREQTIGKKVGDSVRLDFETFKEIFNAICPWGSNEFIATSVFKVCKVFNFFLI